MSDTIGSPEFDEFFPVPEKADAFIIVGDHIASETLKGGDKLSPSLVFSSKPQKEIKRKFHRTVFEIEVLSEEPYAADSLEDISYDITEGHCSGVVSRKLEQTISGKRCAKLLLAQGSDPSFFNLDDRGMRPENFDD